MRLRLAALRNALDYPLRRWIRLRRGGLRFRPEADPLAFPELPPQVRVETGVAARRLLAAYHLEPLATRVSGDNLRENLFYLELLEQALAQGQVELPESGCAADIGPSHWFYVQALTAALRWGPTPAARRASRDFALHGWEADPYRVYADLRSRYDHALAHLDGLAGARYHPEPFSAQPQTYDLITLLFPFVFLPDHLAWGLPQPMFAPAQLLAAAWRSLRPGGRLIVVNQGEAEHAAQAEMWAAAAIPAAAAFRFESPFYAYDLPRYVLVSAPADGRG